jgi:acyl carrier protein
VTDVNSTIVNLIRTLIERREVADIAICPESRLQEDLGFDSLELAELSAALEEDLGNDPYSQGQTPQTVGELLAFYET